MSREKVLLDIFFRQFDEIFDPADLTRLHEMADVVWGMPEAMPRDEFERVKEELFAVVTGSWRHGDVQEMPNLRAILEVGGRHPSPKLVDYAHCFAHNIRVLSCAPAWGPMVAEMALGLAIASGRTIVENHLGFLSGTEKYLHAGNDGAFTLFDKTVGFIGYGGLAANLQPLLAPFRCQILAYDPWLPDSLVRRRGAAPVGLEELLTRSKVIFVLAIPSKENKAMLDRAKLELIGSDSVFVLVSRSHVVDFDALTELLHQGAFRAGIDVFPQEPLPADHPIRSAPGVILSGHRAGPIQGDMHAIGRMVVNDIEAMLAGLPPSEMQIAQPEIVLRLE